MYEQMLKRQRVLERTLGETPGTEAERVAFATAEEAFLAVLKKKTDLLNEADTVQLQLEEDLSRDKANHTVDVENANQAKADVERELGGKILNLEEVNRGLAVEFANYKKGYENGNKAVVDFVAKAKEKAKDAFLMGFVWRRSRSLTRTLRRTCLALMVWYARPGLPSGFPRNS